MLVAPPTSAGDAKVWLFPSPRGEDRDHRRTAARALLRAVLSAETGTPPEDWHFATGESGRPRVVAPALDRMRISLSYGDGAVAIAAAEHREVGVDIEPLEPVGSGEIPWNELTPDERVRLQLMPECERYACFVRMWTLKEAFAKCSGQGAALAFSSVETALDPPGIGIPGGVVPLHLQEVEVDGRRHALAVCTVSPHSPPRLPEISSARSRRG